MNLIGLRVFVCLQKRALSNTIFNFFGKLQCFIIFVTNTKFRYNAFEHCVLLLYKEWLIDKELKFEINSYF